MEEKWYTCKILSRFGSVGRTLRGSFYFDMAEQSILSALSYNLWS